MSLFLPIVLGTGFAMYYFKKPSKERLPDHTLGYTLPRNTLTQKTGEYRHHTFDTIKDYLRHPDVVTNSFANRPMINRGEYGMERFNARLQHSGNVTQFYRSTNLIV